MEQTAIAQGRAKLVWRHMAFLGDESVVAAAASECARDQGKFWPYHDRLFAAQAGRNSGTFSLANLQGFAAELGLNTDSFNECTGSGRYVGRVRAETEAGRQKGVTGTPTLFINGQRIDSGATIADLLNRINLLAPVATPAR